MRGTNDKGNVVVGIVVVVLVVGIVGFWVGRSSVDNQGRSTSLTSDNRESRLVEASYWRPAEWLTLGASQLTDPNPGNCDPATEFNHTAGHIDAVYNCVERPVDPTSHGEEVIEMISAEALNRFNVDTKPRAMRIVSTYVQRNADFPYRPATPETCRTYVSNRVEGTIRANLDLSQPLATDSPDSYQSLRLSKWDHITAQDCGDWTLDLAALGERYGGAFFYEEPLDSFNADTVASGIKPVTPANYPSEFRYQPTTPATCRYYLGDSSYTRQAVDKLFDENSRNGVRGAGFGQNLDLGGWYDYGSPVTVGHNISSYTFMISEGCGDWTRDRVVPTRDGVEPPSTNQIFDHPYETDDFTF